MRFFWALVLSLGLSSCASLMFSKPTVLSKKIELDSMNTKEVQLMLKIEVQNPNPLDLPVQEAEAELVIQDQVVWSQKWTDLTPLKAKQTSTVALPLRLEWKSLWAMGLKVLQKDDILVVARGYAVIRGIKVPFYEQANLNATIRAKGNP